MYLCLLWLSAYLIKKKSVLILKRHWAIFMLLNIHKECKKRFYVQLEDLLQEKMVQQNSVDSRH